MPAFEEAPAIKRRGYVTYTEIEAKLADLHHADLRAGIGALRARIRTLRYLGVPAVPKVGKGSRVEYSFADFWETHFALLLQEVGLSPALVVAIIQQGRRDGQWVSLSQLEKKFGGDVWAAITPINRH